MSNPSIKESECFRAATIEAREKLYNRAVEDDGLGPSESRIVWVTEKYISQAQADIRRRGRIIVFLVFAWTVTSVFSLIREGQRAEAYRLLENEYTRQTHKLPPKVRP